ncbi:glycoside hydrolase family 5 protein [Pseudooctadecabacter sp.]|uniref:glycoside hydrolase family 5 protein n=1 Tax=Pseudooctadecabacter sp. TaxID=1966338 RepID=UPI0035C7FA41
MLRALILLLVAFGPHTSTAQTFPVARCINMGAALEAPIEGDWGYVIQRRHIDRIAQAGFDTIRLPVKFSAHFKNGAFDPAFLARVDEVVGWTQDADLNVILVLHHYWDLMDTGTDAHKANLIAMWRVLGQHYADAPQSVLFELLNEPEGTLTTADAAALYDTILSDLRPAHPTRWIIMGGDEWNNIDSLADLPDPDPYDMHTFHFYEPWQFTHQGAPYVQADLPRSGWGSDADRATLSQRFDVATAQNRPLFLGEFGVYDAAPRPDHIRWLRAVRQAAEAHGIPWCHWGFTQGEQAGFQAFDVDRDDWRAGVLDALMGD